MTAKRHITIIGGGIVGLSCAAALLERGHQVRVIERSDQHDAASWGNAGHIATEQVAPLASLATLRSAPRRRFAVGGALDLPWRAAPSWLPFAARFLIAARPSAFRSGSQALSTLLANALPAWQRASWAQTRDPLLRSAGHFVVWETEPSSSAGQENWARADTGTARFRRTSAAERSALAQLIDTPLGGAIRFDGTAQISDLGRLAATLEQHIADLGGAIVQDHATLRRAGDRVMVDGYDCDLVLVAAGVRSEALVRPVGHRAPLIAERGYHIRGSADSWPKDMPPIVFEDRSMIVTPYEGMVQAASFVELAAVDAPADPRKWERLEQHVRELGLPIGPPFTRWMGARPTLPDYLPAIGRSRRADNLFYAFGHQHLGLTLAPVTAELIGALIDGQTPPINLAPFDLERFTGRGDRV